jgi:hypothetical protein
MTSTNKTDNKETFESKILKLIQRKISGFYVASILAQDIKQLHDESIENVTKAKDFVIGVRRLELKEKNLEIKELNKICDAKCSKIKELQAENEKLKNLLSKSKEFFEKRK